MNGPELRERVRGYLAARNVAVLALVDTVGPWAVPVFYAGVTDTLWFLSDPATRHGRAVGAGAQVSAAITEDHHDWLTIAGLQLTGFCRPVTAAQRAEAAAVYLQKFPFAAAFLDPTGAMYDAAGAKARFYRLDVTDWWFTENATGFGHRRHLPAQQ